MKNIVIKIHSFVDVITNSSTVIYVQSTESTIKTAKELIEKLLKAAGVTKSVDELFDIYIKRDEDYFDEDTDSENDNSFRQDDMGYTHNNLIIKPKNDTQETINLTEQIQTIFAIDGEWDG